MSDSTKNYNEDHMSEIAGKYSQCEKNIDSIIADLNSAKDIVVQNYSGMGEELALDSFLKLSEHLEFLKTCCTSVSEYVLYTLTSMQEADASVANQMKEG